MTSIYLQLNFQKRFHNKLHTFTQETNTTTDKIEDKTKNSLTQLQTHNNNRSRFNYYLKRYENYFHKKLVIKYNALPQEYIQNQINNFIIAKYCHSLASFKENLIYYDIDEFLKEYYKKKESINRIPKFPEFYKSYLDFFCFPTLADLKLNDLIEEMVEKKAKVFYNDNYKDEYNEDGKPNDKKQNNINTIIFTNKIRQEISRKNILTDLSKTTILHKKVSNKSSLTSINTINKLMEYFDNKNYLGLIKSDDLLIKEDKGCFTERSKIVDIDNNIITINDNARHKLCITDKNNNKNDIFNLKNNVAKNMRSKTNYTNNIIKCIKNQYLINQLNRKNKINKSSKNKNSKIQNIKEIKKSNINNNIKIINNNKDKNNNFYSKIKNNKNCIIKKIQNSNNNAKIIHILNNKDEKSKGNNTEREKRNYIPNNIKKKKFDQHFHTFLKIALNFNKISPKKKPIINFKKIINNNNLKISLTDRNKSSHKLKNKIKINSHMNTNLKEYLKYNKKSSRKEIPNKSKKINKLSRNYRFELEEMKTSVIKNSLTNRLKESLKLNYGNWSKKLLNPHNKHKMINKDNNSRNSTQKTLKTSKDKSSFIKKGKSHLTTIDLSQFNIKPKNRGILNYKAINVKKTLLPLNKILINSMGISYNQCLKKNTTLSKIKIPNI